jgi:hypothetical protein
MDKSTNSGRGAVQVLVLVGIVALVGLVFAGGKAVNSAFHIFSSDSKAKTQAQTLVTATQDERNAQAAAAAARALAEANRKSSEAAKQARLDVAHQDVVVVRKELALAPAADPHVRVAQIFAERADGALDPLSQKQLADMQALVDELESKNAAQLALASKKEAEMQAAVDASRASEAKLASEKAVLAAQVASTQAKASALETAVAQDAKKLTKWASDNASLAKRLERFTFWAVLAGALFLVVFWVLPLIGKAFPVTAPFVKWLTSVFAYVLNELHEVEKAVLAEAVHVAKSAAAEAQTLLGAEKAAHANTTATLVAVATSTTPADPVAGSGTAL